MVGSLFQNKKLLLLGSTGFWLLLCVFELLQNYYFAQSYGEEFNLFQRASWAGSYYGSLWLLSILVYLVYRGTSKIEVPKILIIHFPISLVFGVIHFLFTAFLTTSIRATFGSEDSEVIKPFLQIVERAYPLAINGFLMYWLVLILLIALDMYKKYRDQYTFSVELESKLTRSQLQTLKMQLQPHFLFNAMNTIAMMIRRKKDKEAVEMISGLSDMLRSTLTKEVKQMVTLEEEVDLLHKYLKIEQVRFQDTLSTSFELDKESLKQNVPSMILQPIVENAFKHGISKSLGKSHIRISSSVNDGLLLISVYNTGPGLPDGWIFESNLGIGLTNTQNRLAQLYNGNYNLSITNHDAGVQVVLKIPIIADEQS